MITGWRVVVAFILVFLFGGVIGGVAVLRFAVHPAAAAPAVPQPEDFNAQLLRRWFGASRASLLPAQQRDIRLIIEDAAEDLRRLHRDDTYGGTLILEHMQDQVATVLLPPQRAKFEEWVQAQRDRFRDQMQRQRRMQLEQRGLEAQP